MRCWAVSSSCGKSGFMVELRRPRVLHALVKVGLAVASAVLLLAAPLLKVRVPRKADLPLIAVCGLAGMSAYQLLLNWGEVHVPAGTASLLVSVAPVFSVLLAAAFLGERLTATRVLGSAVALGGSTLIAVGSGLAYTGSAWVASVSSPPRSGSSPGATRSRGTRSPSPRGALPRARRRRHGRVRVARRDADLGGRRRRCAQHRRRRPPLAQPWIRSNGSRSTWPAGTGAFASRIASSSGAVSALR
ncbi:DMT family transporter [Amycolatopsis nalaikhensis]|uniref:DMT family transporter n=1 Tax=Amycolatopsis nalaikhensis TaxID=715472 RepID=A0ABY8Y3A2_9PSEU|nr:DMT family transporter [Amycolatopsis sp. 2-2]WIV62266.1 DMT family transporter [Amycolatopsis sp. 2-2]